MALETTTMTMTQDPILKVEHLSMRFGGLMAINDFSFEAYRGDITALIGPNGAGKTTVFNCITGFYKPTMGMITMKQKSERSISSSGCRTSRSPSMQRWRVRSRTSGCSPA